MIPPDIGEGRFTPATPENVGLARARLNTGPNDVYVVARAAENKGYDLVVQALPVLLELQPKRDWFWLLVPTLTAIWR